MTKRTQDCLSNTNYFLHDSLEYVRRFNLCSTSVEAFQRKSWNAKLFIDIRMAYETVLKAVFIYYICDNYDKNLILRKVENFKHNIDKLENKLLVSNLIPIEYKSFINKLERKLNFLPISLRYSIDVYDFIQARNKLYYETIGNDDWLNFFYENTKSLINLIDQELQNIPLEECIISFKDIDFNELFKKGKNKYSIKK